MPARGGRILHLRLARRHDDLCRDRERVQVPLRRRSVAPAVPGADGRAARGRHHRAGRRVSHGPAGNAPAPAPAPADRACRPADGARRRATFRAGRAGRCRDNRRRGVPRTARGSSHRHEPAAVLPVLRPRRLPAPLFHLAVGPCCGLGRWTARRRACPVRRHPGRAGGLAVPGTPRCGRRVASGPRGRAARQRQCGGVPRRSPRNIPSQDHGRVAACPDRPRLDRRVAAERTGLDACRTAAGAARPVCRRRLAVGGAGRCRQRAHCRLPAVCRVRTGVLPAERHAAVARRGAALCRRLSRQPAGGRQLAARRRGRCCRFGRVRAPSGARSRGRVPHRRNRHRLCGDRWCDPAAARRLPRPRAFRDRRRDARLGLRRSAALALRRAGHRRAAAGTGTRSGQRVRAHEPGRAAAWPPRGGRRVCVRRAAAQPGRAPERGKNRVAFRPPCDPSGHRRRGHRCDCLPALPVRVRRRVHRHAVRPRALCRRASAAN